MDLFEERIVQECKKGKKDAFNVLIKNYADRVYNIVIPMIQNKEDAKDISQEVFIKIYKNIHTFQGNSSIGTWIYSIALNTSRDYLRKKKTLRESPLNENDADISSDPQTIMEKTEMGLLLSEAMDRLQDPEKEIIVLKDIMGFSYEEIGNILEINLGTVKSRLSRARCALREGLKTNKEVI